MKKILRTIIMLLAVLAVPSVAHAEGTFTATGDVNDDGSVNISDVTSLIDHLLGGTSGSFNDANADVDADSHINIADVTYLIDYLLSGKWPGDGPRPATQTFTVNGVSFTMVTVEGGTFTMGATPDQGDEEYLDMDNWGTPTPHEVTLSTFTIGQTEVSQDLWRAVMGVHPSYFRYRDNLPVELMSWDKCHEFILKLNEMTGKQFRLPTEAEWEYAARGGNLSKGYKYSGSNDIEEAAWYWDNIPSHDIGAIYLYGTQPMATKVPNELGLYHMSGNVSEWCLDFKYYYGNDSDAQSDPVGPVSGEQRARRGGSWGSPAPKCRVSFSQGGQEESSQTGLRLVLDEDDSPKFRTSETVVTVIVGEERTVELLNGDGSYTVAGGEDYLASSIEAGRLVVSGKNVGTATVQVTDITTGATAVVTVIVKPVEKYTVNGVTFTMVAVEGGAFSLGRNEEAGSHLIEGEVHDPYMTYVRDFSIGKTEVTQELWQAVMGTNPSYYKGDLNRPVEQVSWEDCQEFIAKLNELTGLGFRLPTEAEWEFAACGGNLRQSTTYSGGNNIDEVAWYSNNIPSQSTQPVGTKSPNELGIHDMNGNVWEWCQDWSDGFENYFMEEMDDPVLLTHHLRRGGCWSSSKENCNVLTYGCSLPAESNSRLGLRLVFGGEGNYPKVCFAKRRVPLLVGESSSVIIKHGWGKYSVKGGEGIVSCTVSGEQLNITGISAGDAVILLTNVYTGDVAELEINVLGAEHFNVNGVEFTMQPVQGGEFTMGALNGEILYPNQYGEPYEVELNPYYMAETEVTQALWQVVMGENPSFFDGDPERPVEMVSWEDCQEFITRLNQMTGGNFCLPTEAQWEFAARGGNNSHDYSYAGSSSIDPVAWYWDNIPSQVPGTQGYGTQAVATKSPNELGLYDMSGNVMEWTWDWYADYRWSPSYDPTGPYTGTTRSVRGGGWNTGQQNCGVVYRDSVDPTVRNEAIGLRLAMRIPFYW